MRRICCENIAIHGSHPLCSCWGAFFFFDIDLLYIREYYFPGLRSATVWSCGDQPKHSKSNQLMPSSPDRATPLCGFCTCEQAYMQPLFELTLRTIKEDQEEVALNAIEFWSSLCEEEVCVRVCTACMSVTTLRSVVWALSRWGRWSSSCVFIFMLGIDLECWSSTRSSYLFGWCCWIFFYYIPVD